MLRVVKELGDKVKRAELTWNEAAEEYNRRTGERLIPMTFRKRYERKCDVIERTTNARPRNNKKEQPISTGEYETIYGDGTIEAQKIVNLSPSEKANADLVLKKLGYDPVEWEMVMMTFANWQMHTKEQTTKELYSVKFRIKPRIKTATNEDYIQLAIDNAKENIKPLKLEKVKKKTNVDNDLIIEAPAMELHLGKMSHYLETGENYDYKIATERFSDIINEIITMQDITKAGTLFLSIGNDFFNTDTPTYTTTKGTPQNNDLRWQKMYLTGLKLYTEALNELRKHFNKIDVGLVVGNHDQQTSFHLFIALMQYFRNEGTINFIEDFKKTQCYKFGKCAIFTNHGETNLKRLMKSIPAEFYEEWGTSLYRELHLGHLHKEVVVDDESGMITRRVGSPSGTDEWHYNERFVGSLQKYQVFIWNKEQGLKAIHYINFDPVKKKDEKQMRLIR